ncbi:MAG TPA: GIY-YIG nuclease family protein [Alphaproteobacteria bacterium]|jgi:putative endonuclease
MRSTSIKGGFVHIVASRSLVLYTGVTSDLEKRVWQHKNKAIPGFTARCNVDRLLHYEFYGEIAAAIAREKQIKGWVRRRKLELIARENPGFIGLAPELFDWAKEKMRG